MVYSSMASSEMALSSMDKTSIVEHPSSVVQDAADGEHDKQVNEKMSSDGIHHGMSPHGIVPRRSDVRFAGLVEPLPVADHDFRPGRRRPGYGIVAGGGRRVPANPNIPRPQAKARGAGRKDEGSRMTGEMPARLSLVLPSPRRVPRTPVRGLFRPPVPGPCFNRGSRPTPGCGWAAGACGPPWLRSGGCARGSRGRCARPPPRCSCSRRPGRSGA